MLPTTLPRCVARRIVVTIIVAQFGVIAPARAGSVEVVAVRPLDFGSIVMFGSGSKRVDPDGASSTDSLLAVRGVREGAAEFTIRYRPDGSAKSPLVSVSIAAAGTRAHRGTVATLDSLVTDLPGLGGLGFGEVRPLQLPVCASPVCDVTFRVGGTLTLSGGDADTAFSFPLQVTVRLLGESAG